jgi:hypothetical protein
MWLDNLPQASLDPLGQLRPDEILFEFNGPKIFTSIGGFGQLLLCYECDEDDEGSTYLVAPCGSRTVEHLDEGSVTVFEALNQPWLWAVRRDHTGLRAWKLDSLDVVPARNRPFRDATLKPESMPLLTYRLIGEGLAPGKVPASVVAMAVTRPTLAIRRLMQILGSRSATGGRPDNAFRALYDLEAQRFAYNSFEVSLRPPEQQQPELGASVYDAGAEALKNAISWLEETDETIEPALLEVLDALAPPVHGRIQKAEIRGALVGTRRITLDREDTKRIRAALKSQAAPELIETRGRIRELDRDKRSFTLRERPDSSPELNCTYSDELFDTVWEAFDAEVLVHLQGKLSTRGILEVTALEQVTRSASN